MNFVLFMPDELRAESVGCYGHPLVRTPNIDRLAEEGVRFDQTFTQHTICGPSRCAVMSGWYPHVAGHRNQTHLLRPHEPNLFKYLKRAGYDVFWRGKNDLLAAASFPDSVTSAAFSSGPFQRSLWGDNPYEMDDPLFYSFLYEAYEGDIKKHRDADCVLSAIDFLKSRSAGDKPFMVYLPLVYPHCPYAAPQPWHDMYDRDELPPLRPAGLENKPNYYETIRQTRRMGQWPEGTLQEVNARYLGMTSFLDHTLGWMLDALDETGLADDTAVIFFSDHGDYAGDYGLVEKWYTGHEDCLTRVPLVIRAPGGKANHSVAECTQLIDIMATVLDLAGIEAQHTHFSKSLLPQIQGASGDPNGAAFIEGGFDAHEPHCFEGRGDRLEHPESPYYPLCVAHQTDKSTVVRTATIRTTAHRMTVRGGGCDELYDLARDPLELNNLAGRSEYAETQRELERSILEWYIHTGDVVPFDEDPRGLPS